MLGYDPEPRRGAALPARASHARRRADEDVEAARRRRVPRRVHRRDRRRRSALVPRQPRPRPDDRDRRRPRSREVAEEPRLLRPVRARAHRGHPAQRRRRGDVDAEPTGAARAGGARADQAARRASRASPPRRRRSAARRAIPTYAIRVADDFHRFYHEHRVLESEQQAFRLALCRATQLVIARALDLVGCRRARPHVTLRRRGRRAAAHRSSERAAQALLARSSPGGAGPSLRARRRSRRALGSGRTWRRIRWRVVRRADRLRDRDDRRRKPRGRAEGRRSRCSSCCSSSRSCVRVVRHATRSRRATSQLPQSSPVGSAL